MRCIIFAFFLLALPLLAQAAAISEPGASVHLSTRQDEPGVCRPAEYCHALSPCYKVRGSCRTKSSSRKLSLIDVCFSLLPTCRPPRSRRESATAIPTWVRASSSLPAQACKTVTESSVAVAIQLLGISHASRDCAFRIASKALPYFSAVGFKCLSRQLQS